MIILTWLEMHIVRNTLLIGKQRANTIRMSMVKENIVVKLKGLFELIKLRISSVHVMETWYPPCPAMIFVSICLTLIHAWLGTRKRRRKSRLCSFTTLTSWSFSSNDIKISLHGPMLVVHRSQSHLWCSGGMLWIIEAWRPSLSLLDVCTQLFRPVPLLREYSP